MALLKEQTAHILIIVALAISVGLLAYHAYKMAAPAEQYSTTLAAMDSYAAATIPDHRYTAFAQENADRLAADGIVFEKDGINAGPWYGGLKTNASATFSDNTTTFSV